MLAFEYIKSELKIFINEFPKTRVRYENDINSNTHSIEVVPNEIYHLDKDYINWESTFFDKFINDFPDQNICFISDDAIVGLYKIDFVLFGKEYVSIKNIIPTSSSTNISTDIYINNIQINTKSNQSLKNIKGAIYTQPTTRLDLITNLINENNVISQNDYPLAA